MSFKPVLLKFRLGNFEDELSLNRIRFSGLITDCNGDSWRLFYKSILTDAENNEIDMIGFALMTSNGACDFRYTLYPVSER